VPFLYRALAVALPLFLAAGCASDGPDDSATGSSSADASASEVSGYSSDISSTELLGAEGSTILDQLIAYPETGQAEITAGIIEIPPGVETGWHFHEVPLFVYVLSGTVTVTYDTDNGEVTKAYSSGEPLLEAIGTHHNGRNEGDEPVRLIAVYMGADGSANVVKL